MSLCRSVFVVDNVWVYLNPSNLIYSLFMHPAGGCMCATHAFATQKFTTTNASISTLLFRCLTSLHAASWASQPVPIHHL
jgi:hypothetical protein